MHLIVLASGNLGLNVCNKIHYPIEYIFTDKSSIGIIEFAKAKNIPFFIGNPRNVKDFSFLNNYSDSWIISINYLFIIPQLMIDVVHGNALNIHGSLLPKYRGRTPHIWAIINGETETGITVHKLVESVDSGDIVLQRKIKINEDDTGGSVLEKYSKVYPEIIKETLELLAQNKVHFIQQNHSLASYFPKRTPLDGKICWDWQDLRIINWVRAQTKPYPGAFSMILPQGKQLYIWHCEKDVMGFSHEIKNGTVVKKDTAIYVKCPNRVLKISEYTGEVCEGDILQ